MYIFLTYINACIDAYIYTNTYTHTCIHIRVWYKHTCMVRILILPVIFYKLQCMQYAQFAFPLLSIIEKIANIFKQPAVYFYII